MSIRERKGRPVVVKSSQDPDLVHARNFLEAISHGHRSACDASTALEDALPCHLVRAA